MTWLDNVPSEDHLAAEARRLRLEEELRLHQEEERQEPLRRAALADFMLLPVALDKCGVRPAVNWHMGNSSAALPAPGWVLSWESVSDGFFSHTGAIELVVLTAGKEFMRVRYATRKPRWAGEKHSTTLASSSKLSGLEALAALAGVRFNRTNEGELQYEAQATDWDTGSTYAAWFSLERRMLEVVREVIEPHWQHTGMDG